jgi:phosphoserine phosphatase
VSGGFSLFTQHIGDMIGFDENHANMLMVEDGKLTGFVEEPILGREAKLDTLLELARHLQVPLERTIAIGDGANDLAMIERAGLGVAYHAKPAVAAAAQARIDRGDLTALLYVPGYRRADFSENAA